MIWAHHLLVYHCVDVCVSVRLYCFDFVVFAWVPCDRLRSVVRYMALCMCAILHRVFVVEFSVCLWAWGNVRCLAALLYRLGNWIIQRACEHASSWFVGWLIHTHPKPNEYVQYTTIYSHARWSQCLFWLWLYPWRYFSSNAFCGRSHVLLLLRVCSFVRSFPCVFLYEQCTIACMQCERGFVAWINNKNRRNTHQLLNNQRTRGNCALSMQPADCVWNSQVKWEREI